MPHHVSVTLADGREACADYREPIVRAMRRMLLAVSEGQPVPAGADAEVACWLDDPANAERSAGHIAARWSCCPVGPPPGTMAP